MPTGGAGGCPFAPRATGNIPTEDLIFMLAGMGIETGVDLEAFTETARWSMRNSPKPRRKKIHRPRSTTSKARSLEFFVVGNNLTIGDVGIATSFVDFNHAGYKVDAGRWPRLAASIGQMHSRPSFKTVIDAEVKTYHFKH
jgi:hypothetical protein